MAASFTVERVDSVSATDATSYEFVTGGGGIGVFTPGANSLLVAVIQGAETTDATYDISTLVDDTGLTWTRYGTDFTWTNTQFYRLHIFTAQVGGSPSQINTLTATWSETILACNAWVGEFSGHNTTTPIKQHDQINNASGTDPSVTLSPAPDSDSCTLFICQTRRNPPGWTAGANWSEEMDRGVSTPVTGLYVARNTTTVQTSFTSSGTDALNQSIILEIDAASAVANTVTHTAPNLAFAGGTHLKALRRSHTAPNLALAGGTHTVRAGRRIAHIAANLQFAGGTHTAAKSKVVTHVAPNLQLVGGTHARRTSRAHVAPNLQLAGGTHTATKSKVVFHTAPNLQFQGGTHLRALRRSHTAPNLAFAAGTHTAAKAKVVTHVAPNLQLQGGTHARRASRAHVAPNLQLIGGTHTARKLKVVTHTAPNLQLQAGTHARRLLVALVAPNLQLQAGTHTATRGVAGLLILGHRGLTAGAAPSGSLTILGTEGLTAGAAPSGDGMILAHSGLTVGAPASGAGTTLGHGGLTAGSPPSGKVLVLGRRET